MVWTAVTTPAAGAAVATGAFGIPVANNMAVLGNAWTAYVPTTANVTVSNGTLGARARIVGKTLDVQIQLSFGSTTALGGSPTFTIPAGLTAFAVGTASGDCSAFDSSAGTWFDIKAILTSTTVIGTRAAPTALGNSLSLLSSSNPIPWGVGDVLTINLSAEVS